MKRVLLLALATGCAQDPSSAFDVRGSIDGATHVVASAGTDRVIAEVDAGGGFALALAPGRPWTISFADSRAPHMLLGTLRANGLDALAPALPGSLDLGDITVHDGFATSSVGWQDLIAALGMTEDAAVAQGAHDDLALRYGNPDLDGDGAIDTTGVALDFYARLNLDVTPDELVRGTPPRGYTYLGTGMRAVAPGMAMTSPSVTFDAPFYGSWHGPSTPVIPAMTPVTAPEVRTGTLAGVPAMGVFARPYHDVPSGTYRIDLDDRELTFDRVQPPTDAALRSPQRPLPVVHLVPVNAACRTDCAVDRVDLTWTDGVPRPAKIDFEPPLTRETTTWQLCYVGITYEDAFGIETTAQIANPACP
jgi:hypothetical protein